MLGGLYLIVEKIYARVKLYFGRSKEKSIPQNLSKTEAKFYAQALTELESDELDHNVWAKAYAEASDEESSKRLYVKLRASDLEFKKQNEPDAPEGLNLSFWPKMFLLLILFIIVANAIAI